MAVKKQAKPVVVHKPPPIACEKTVIRILAFDPGSTEMGWSLIDYDRNTGISTVVKSETLVGRKLLNNNKELKAVFSKAFCILEAYSHIIQKLVQTLKPDFVISEGAFQGRFPQAYASLTLVIHTIRRAVCEVMGEDIYIVAPMETKKEVAQNHMADKDMIKAKILINPTIVFGSDVAVDTLTEHSFDSIGHGYCFIRRILPSLCA